MNKALKYSLISIASLILLFIITGFIIVFFYQDEISKYIIGEINKNLKTEIKVEKINFSVFKKFPDASVEFQNVFTKSTKGFNKKEFIPFSTDTLLSAKSIFLQFNIIDIFKKRYKISKIHIVKGKICLFVDEHGKDNFHFWKSNASSDTSSFQLKLKKISFSDVKFIYISHQSRINLKLHSKKFLLNGDFSSDSYSLSTHGELFADRFMMDDINYIKSENASVEIDVNVKNNEFLIEKGMISLADMKLNVTGKILLQKQNSLDLVIKGKDIDIQSFISILPEKYSQFKNDYLSEGNFYFETQLSGIIDSIHSAHIETKFGVQNGSVKKENSNIKLNNVFLEGYYSNGHKNSSTTSVLKLNKFKTEIGNGKISGQFLMENFNHPKIELTADANFKLNEMQDFFKIDTIQKIDGALKTQLKFKGTINNPDKFTTEDFRNSIASGTLILENTNLEIKNDPKKYSDINGIFTFDNNDIEINSLTFNTQENDFKLKGFLKNILCYLMVKNERFSVNGEVSSANLNINKLLDINPDKSKSELKINLPEDMDLMSTLSVSNFTFSNFNAKNLTGNIYYSSKKLSVENFSLQTLQGNINGSGTISQSQDGDFNIVSHTKLEKLNIRNLFSSFNNFGQKFIQDKNLNGFITADVTLSSQWSSSLKCNLKKLIVASNVIINNGELNDFKPMEELAHFIDLNELKNIHFSEIKNDILIKDEKIIIPQMDINSSAINITVSGEQYFDSRLDYRLKVLLSDILFKKAKNNKKENDEFGVLEDDDHKKTSLHLLITGTTDNFKIRYDTKKVKENIKEAIKDEKKNIKTILNEEFGLFKNDTAIANNKKRKEEEEKKKKKKKVRVQWDENGESEKDHSIE